MSESAGDAKVTFASDADFSYVSQHVEEFETAVDGTITSRNRSSRQLTFSFRVAATVAAAAGALLHILNRFFPRSRWEVLVQTDTDPVTNLEILDIHKVGGNFLLRAAATQYNVNFQFVDQETQIEFFNTEHLKLCLSREVNNESNTCWLALEQDNFNAGETSVGWDVTFVASQISESVVRNGGVITPPTSHSPGFSMGQEVTLEATGYWAPTPSAGQSGKLAVVNERTINVYVGLSQQASGDPQPKPIYAAPYPVAAQPTYFEVEQNLFVWGSNTVVQGQVTATTYTMNSKFIVAPGLTPTIYISKSPANQWVFSTARPSAKAIEHKC